MRVESQESSFTQGHCRRVEALAGEIGRRAGFAAALVSQLEQAARLHHSSEALLNPTPLARLVERVMGNQPDHHGIEPRAAIEPGAAAVLSVFHRRPSLEITEEFRRLAGVLHVCNFVDEQFEALEFEHKEVDTILDEVQSFAAFEGFDPDLLDHVRRLRCGDSLARLRSGDDGLPVEARHARQVFHALGTPREYEVHELAAVAERDPVLAASIIRVANSALFGRAKTISTVRKAISHVGTETSRNVLLAAALRPLFASAGLSQIWSHSVSAAQFCSALAAQTGLLSVEESMLLGLVHDMGALAIPFIGRDAMTTYASLVQKGCPPTYVERLLFGCDHGEIGAEFLALWEFPAHLVEAVRFHHQPERSPSLLVAFTHLAEFWSGLDEDLPSFNRVDECMSRTGISLDTLVQTGVRDNALNALRSVA